jgi:predicted nuclease of predicted toxin-antitoxin system
MKVLLDECLPVDFRHCLRGHEVHSVQWAGLKGKKNGELLQAAEAVGYDVLLTVDQGIPHQAQSGNRRIAVLVLYSQTNQMADLELLTGPVLETLSKVRPGEMIAVRHPG